MNRSELEHAILTASQIINQSEVLIVGSQAILGSYAFAELPERATLSAEVDIAPLVDIGDHLSTRLDLEAGQWSEFDNENGFYIDGVSLQTAVLPAGWQERLVRVPVPGRTDVVGLCLEPHDLCASKLARNEDKDRQFVTALIDARLIRARLLRNRIDLIPDSRLAPDRKLMIRRFVMAAEEQQREAP